MRDHVSPINVLSAIDLQLRDYLNVTFGGIVAAKRVLSELDRAELPGDVLAVLISRYDDIVQTGATSGDAILRLAQLVAPLAAMSRTDRCSGIQLRAALAILSATRTAGHAERVEVIACRAEIEGNLLLTGDSAPE